MTDVTTIVPLTILRRVLLVAVAFGGSAIYALSFALAYDSSTVTAMACLVGLAAGTSWIIFGLVLLGTTHCRPTVLAWADACLVTMGAGIATKSASIVLNLGSYPTRSSPDVTHVPMEVHYGVLIS